MDASAHGRGDCVTAIFQASDVIDHVDPQAEFPRSGLLAERLGRTRRPGSSVPCDGCGIGACSTRTILDGHAPGPAH